LKEKGGQEQFCSGWKKNWIPAPRFRGDKFTDAKAGAGMTVLRVVLD